MLAAKIHYVLTIWQRDATLCTNTMKTNTQFCHLKSCLNISGCFEFHPLYFHLQEFKNFGVEIVPETDQGIHGMLCISKSDLINRGKVEESTLHPRFPFTYLFSGFSLARFWKVRHMNLGVMGVACQPWPDPLWPYTVSYSLF